MSTVITLSRSLGSMGSYIAATVAKQFQLRYLDREILHSAAEKAEFPDDTMIEMLEHQEKVPGLLDKIFSWLDTLPPTPSIASATMREGNIAYTPQMAIMIEQVMQHQERRAKASEAYVQLVHQVMYECADTGNVIIVGRGGQMVLRDMPTALHVRIHAPREVRIRNLMERTRIDAAEAEKRIRQSDKQRVRYMKHFYNVDWADPGLYHMVLNTGHTSTAMAVSLIGEAVWQLEK